MATVSTRPAPSAPTGAGPGPGGRPLRAQLARFAAVGVVATLVQLGLYAVLERVLSDQGANLVSLALSTVVNTALNRRWTFAVTGRGAWAQQAQGFAVFLVTWGFTAAALALLHAVVPDPGTLVEVGTLAVAVGASTVLRFVAMRRWIFAGR